MLRIGLTFTLLSLIIFILPVVNVLGSAPIMIVAVGIVGVLVGVGSGWLYALAAIFSHKCTAYILIGQGISTLVILADTRAFPFEYSNFFRDDLKIILYFGLAGGISIIGTIIFAIMMFTNDARKALIDNVYPLDIVDFPDDPIDNYSLDVSFSGATSLSKESLVSTLWMAYLSSFITNFGIVAATAIVTIVSKEASNDPKFPEIMLYVTAFSSLLGNELAVLLDKLSFINKQWQLLILSSIRILMFPSMILYAKLQIWLNDIAFYCFVAVYALSGAYANSKCYA